MREAEDFSDVCASMPMDRQIFVRELLARVVDKWSLWVLAELYHDGPLRFSRLLERIEGVSQKSLTAALRQLERNGFVTRAVVVQVPIRVDYAITTMGQSLVQQIEPLYVWAVQQLPALLENQHKFDQASSKREE